MTKGNFVFMSAKYIFIFLSHLEIVSIHKKLFATETRSLQKAEARDLGLVELGFSGHLPGKRYSAGRLPLYFAGRKEDLLL